MINTPEEAVEVIMSKMGKVRSEYYPGWASDTGKFSFSRLTDEQALAYCSDLNVLSRIWGEHTGWEGWQILITPFSVEIDLLVGEVGREPITVERKDYKTIQEACLIATARASKESKDG